MPALTDAELMQQFVAGDEKAFRALVERHRSPLVNFLYRHLWDRDAAEDMAQEVFCKLVVHSKQYQPQGSGSFKAYMYRIAMNMWINKCRKDGRRPQVLSLNRPADGKDAPQFADRVVDRYRTPKTAFEQEEVMQAIQQAIQSLPEEQQMVFNLSEGQGLKYLEIATALDIPLGTVKSRLHLAVKKLRGMLRNLPRSDKQKQTDAM